MNISIRDNSTTTATAALFYLSFFPSHFDIVRPSHTTLSLFHEIFTCLSKRGDFIELLRVRHEHSTHLPDHPRAHCRRSTRLPISAVVRVFLFSLQMHSRLSNMRKKKKERTTAEFAILHFKCTRFFSVKSDLHFKCVFDCETSDNRRWFSPLQFSTSLYTSMLLTSFSTSD